MNSRANRLAWLISFLIVGSTQAENRSIDGTGNTSSQPSRGGANTPFIRQNYKEQFFGSGGCDAHRNAASQRPHHQ